jgi:hypothetical protein
MPRHDPTIPASDATAFANVELIQRQDQDNPKRFRLDILSLDRAMLMAHILHRLVRRHALDRRYGGVRY